MTSGFEVIASLLAIGAIITVTSFFVVEAFVVIADWRNWRD